MVISWKHVLADPPIQANATASPPQKQQLTLKIDIFCKYSYRTFQVYINVYMFNSSSHTTWAYRVALGLAGKVVADLVWRFGLAFGQRGATLYITQFIGNSKYVEDFHPVYGFFVDFMRKESDTLSLLINWNVMPTYVMERQYELNFSVHKSQYRKVL